MSLLSWERGKSNRNCCGTRTLFTNVLNTLWLALPPVWAREVVGTALKHPGVTIVEALKNHGDKVLRAVVCRHGGDGLALVVFLGLKHPTAGSIRAAPVIVWSISLH